MGDNNVKNKIESYHDIYQKLNLSDDFLFSKVMQDEEILRLLLEKILKFPIKKVCTCTVSECHGDRSWSARYKA